jgi:hypothetical protein
MLNKKFRGILTSGKITHSPPLEHEIANQEYLNLPRLSMNFNMHDYGELVEMIRLINTM